MLVWNGYITAEAARRCSEEGVSISIGTPNGQFLVRTEGFPRGNISLRRVQYRLSDDPEWKLKHAKMIVTAKCRTQKDLVARHRRDQQAPELRTIETKLETYGKMISTATSEKELLGIEGIIASEYFSSFPTLIKNPLTEWEGRSRRPPKSPENALLSFLYAVATNDCKSALALVGLDPYCGIYHHDQSGRPSLALDLLEEFRIRLGDQTMLALINRKQITLDDFESGSKMLNSWSLTEKGRKKTIKHYQERKNEEIFHTAIGKKISWGLVPIIQARLLARAFRSEETYTPFHLQ